MLLLVGVVIVNGAEPLAFVGILNPVIVGDGKLVAGLQKYTLSIYIVIPVGQVAVDTGTIHFK